MSVKQVTNASLHTHMSKIKGRSAVQPLLMFRLAEATVLVDSVMKRYCVYHYSIVCFDVGCF